MLLLFSLIMCINQFDTINFLWVNNTHTIGAQTMKCPFLGCSPFKMFPVYRQVAVESKTYTTSYFGTNIKWGGAYFQPQIGIRCACEEKAMVSTLNFLDTPFMRFANM